MEEMVAVTFFVELPHVLPLEQDTAVLSMGERQGWQGWNGADIAHFVGAGAEGAFPADVVPEVRLVFRRTTVKTALPLQAADQAFGDFVEPVLRPRDRRARRRNLRRYQRKGVILEKSVVAMSFFVPGQSKRFRDDQGEWLLDRAERGLTTLNDFLSLLGVSAGDWRITPVNLGDLPAVLPVLMQSSDAEEMGRAVGMSFLFPLHDRLPAVTPTNQLSSELVEHTAWMTGEAVRERQPFLLVFRLLHQAVVDYASGRFPESILGLGTAFEVLVSVLITEAGRRRGWSPEELQGAADAPYRSRVKDHLSKATASTIDLDDPTSPWGRWWEDGYGLRNRVAHEGAEPGRAETERALDAGAELLVALRKRLAADDLTADLGEALAIELRRGEPLYRG
jgi:hypothetical protein